MTAMSDRYRRWIYAAALLPLVLTLIVPVHTWHHHDVEAAHCCALCATADSPVAAPVKSPTLPLEHLLIGTIGTPAATVAHAFPPSCLVARAPPLRPAVS